MHIEEDILARVYSFDLQFKGGRRTSFYRKLFGFKSKTTREDQEGREKVYEHFYPGLLTSIPHLRLGKSVIAVPKDASKDLDSFFGKSKWGPIDLYSFDGLLPSEDRMEAMEDVLTRVKLGDDRPLSSELDSLISQISSGSLDSAERHRVERVLEEAERLKGFDWTDDSKFSSILEERIEPLKKWIS